MGEFEEIMNDEFYTEIIGNCVKCGNETKRGESQECEKCNKLYCMYCVTYDVDEKTGISAIIKCPENHFIASACFIEDEDDLENLK